MQNKGGQVEWIMPWPWPWQLTSEGANSLDATRMQTSLEDCIDIGYMLIEYMVK